MHGQKNIKVYFQLPLSLLELDEVFITDPA